MIAILFFFLAGLAAVGFLAVVWRRRQMPPLLRALLIIGAAAVAGYVAWTLIAVLKHAAF